MICITQIALLISNLLHLHMLNASQWAVLSSSSIKPSCQNQTCGPTRPTHSYCLPRKPDKIITPACRRFKHFHRLRIRDTSIRKIVDGHNGLRNRVALNYWQPASNMKLLHWDKDLQRMAEGWLAQCQLDKQDECDYLFNKSFTVGQNRAHSKTFPGNNWAIKIIRKWYLEGNSLDEKTSKEVLKKWRPIRCKYNRINRQANYTQLVWAATQFVGCAAARVNKGYTMVCNYHPAGNVVGQPVYEFGSTACSDCSLDRSSCSRIFHGLCGIDDSDQQLERSHVYVIYVVIAVVALSIVGIAVLIYKL